MPADGMIPEEDFLLISGLQHFAYCTRQWALIHLEGLWAENLLTVEGELMHEKAHNPSAGESRGDTLIMRGMRIFSATLGLVGSCDVVEFHRSTDGVPLAKREGLWLPFPVEYKRGKPKSHRADELQLCAQAMCLEKMLCCKINEGALFYGETRRRQNVAFDTELRGLVAGMAAEMHRYAKRGYTPKVKPNKGCVNCSLKDLCLPALQKNRSAADWIAKRLGEVTLR